MDLIPIIPFEPVSRESVPEGEQWIHQVKWDGVRILVYADGTECRLFNRKLNERTMNYPELTDISAYCRTDAVVLDGEIIALGADGKPSFHEVMRRDSIRRADRIAAARRAVSVTYMAFDLLYVDGEWLTGKPLHERMALLNQVLKPCGFVQQVPSFADGGALFQLMRQQGMEGIVSKDRNSVYASDKKDDRWIKVKNYGDLIAVIGGFTLNGGIVNAVLVGVYDAQRKLHFIGHVGTGKMARSEWAKLTKLLAPTVCLDMPFMSAHPEMRDPVWVTPRIAVKVQFAEWRWREGRTLRQPSIQAFVDVPPQECVFDFRD